MTWTWNGAWQRVLLASVATLGVSCDSQDCLTIVHPAIMIQVQDSASGEQLGLGVQGEISGGAFTDSLVMIRFGDFGAQIAFAAGYARPGVYDVEVSKSGYARWTREDVLARPARCVGVETTELVARLRPIATGP